MGDAPANIHQGSVESKNASSLPADVGQDLILILFVGGFTTPGTAMDFTVQSEPGFLLLLVKLLLLMNISKSGLPSKLPI